MTSPAEITIEELKTNLQDKLWRLNNLYWIIGKDGKPCKFTLWKEQKCLYENLHNRNVILKVRQRGVTTFFAINNLDETLFKMIDSGLVAHRLPDAEKIFTDKVKYAWDNLPKVLKNQWEVDASSTKQLRFSRAGRKSLIYVGTSLRSATVQRLHITELSYLDRYYPAKAKEIKTGALSTVAKEQVVTIESTYKDEGVFSSICRNAYRLKKDGTPLTEMDYRFFFFPWYDAEEYSMETPVYINEKKQEYFDNLEHQIGHKISMPHKYWYIKKAEEQGEEMIQEYPSTPEEVLEAPVESAIFKKEMALCIAENRVCSVPVHKTIECETWWDLGNGKNMSIVITQQIGQETHIIDFITDAGSGMAEYAAVLKNKGYIYKAHHMPHDAKPPEIGSGKSIMEQAMEAGIKPVQLVPNIAKRDRILAGKNFFNRVWIDKDRAAHLVLALKVWSWERDEASDGILPDGTVIKAYKKEPEHNWASHPGDAFTYMSVGYRYRSIDIPMPQQSIRTGKNGY